MNPIDAIVSLTCFLDSAYISYYYRKSGKENTKDKGNKVDITAHVMDPFRSV